jgi:hypothetical protein
VRELLERVRSARVLLAVIGPRWLTVTDPGDSIRRRRIDDPADGFAGNSRKPSPLVSE